MKAYAIFENEAKALTHFNTLATITFSVASALVSLALGIWINAAFYERLTPEGHALSCVVAPILCVLAIGAFIFAVVLSHNGKSTWEDIRSQSRDRVPNENAHRSPTPPPNA